MFDFGSFENCLAELDLKMLKNKCASWSHSLNSKNVSEKSKILMRQKYEVAVKVRDKKKYEELDRQRAMWVDYWNSFTD